MTGPVAVTGATGLLGRAVLRARPGLGAVRALVRDGSSAPDGVEVVRGHLLDRDALAKLVQGCSGVLHLAAAMGSSPAEEMHDINVNGTRRLLEAAEAAGVPRFVFTSSVAARRPEQGPYSQSKALAEERVDEASLQGVVLRLPVLYGPGSQVEAAVLGLGRKLPVVPVIGGGDLRPVHVDDAAAACIAAILKPDLGGTYTLAGSDALPFADFATRLLKARGLRGRAIGLPPSLFVAAAVGLELMGRRGVTVESVRAAAAGTPPPSSNLHQLGWTARPLAEGLSA